MASRILHESRNDNDEEVTLVFVIPLNLKQQDCNDDMREAYSRCSEKEAGLEPTWKSEEDCLRMKPTKRHVFVLQEFKGPAFDYLQDFKCVICGPRCLIQCLMLDETMPNVSYPVFTAAMTDLVVTCSGGGLEVKKAVKEKVELMGGTFLKNFNCRTTHVVVVTVSSSKYEKALELGIPVRTVKWIESVWDRSLKEYIKATDASFDAFKCPPFLNLQVCSSGFIIKETERIKNTVNKYGGIYSSSLTSSVNILVVKNPKGDKFKFAKSWSIPCVENKWIYDSVMSGHALPTKTYEVEGRAASSPTRDDLEAVSFSANVSNILFDQRSQIEETMMNSSTLSTASYCPVNKPSTPRKMPPPAAKKTPIKTPVKTTAQTFIAPGKLKYLLQELNISQTKKAGAFLDGCGVYLVGWSAEEEENLKKILKCSGAARFSDLSDQVSHILVGNLEKTFLRTLKTLHHKPHVVNIKWLIQSVADKHPAPEEPFTCLPRDDLNVSEAPSPLSKKGMALLQRENFSPQKSSPVKQVDNGEESCSSNRGNVLLAKYISSDMPNRTTLSTSAIDMPPPPAPSFKHKFSHLGDSNPNGNDSDIVLSQGDALFSGLTFIIVGLNEEATEYVEGLIRKHGGVVAKKSFKGVPDYAVVPLTHASLLQTACEIINSLWIESCIEEDKIIPVEYYHQPVVLDESKRPLEGCVLGLSGFSGKERQFIMELATSMGAICQDVFAKKSKSDAKASSHLICKTNDKTEKFNAAMKWGRPAMYHSWLLTCASSGTRAPEANHLVDPSQVIIKLPDINSSTSSITDTTSMQTKVESAQVAALRKLPCFQTPERTPILYDQAKVDKILSYKPSPNPHAVATPPIPIGISENPTPGESKRMQKWLNKLPEKAPSPPPRRDSTPLHELRRRIIEAHSVTTPEMLHLVPIKDGGIPLDDSSESPNLRDVQNKDTSLRSSPRQSNQGSSCNTPTGGLSTTSRKLFDNVQTESPLDGQLEKLNKLIAAPSFEESGSSAKIVTRPHPKYIDQKEQHIVYDALRHGSQPYAIKWEDPVNVKRSVKADTKEDNESVLVPSNENIIHESSSKRKSSENAESPPDVKKPSLENAHSVKKQPSKVYKISFSSVGEKGQYHNIIKELGGVVVESSTYSMEATHLILERAPQRSEKLLAFIAAGRWILHISFLRESQKQKKFVKEEDFEWGNPQNKSLSKVKLSDVEDALARAAHRWRSLIASGRSKGAFENFCCKVYATDDGKASAFERLISAGGGKVLPATSSEKPSFCLVHASRKEVIVECAKLGILCVPLTFLYDHLTVDPSPDPQSRVINEYANLRNKFLS